MPIKQSAVLECSAEEGWRHSGQGRVSPKERFELRDNDEAERTASTKALRLE